MSKLFIGTSSDAANGKRAYYCQLSRVGFTYTTGNEQSRNEAESACRQHQAAIIDNLLATQGLKRDYELPDALAAYERSLL